MQTAHILPVTTVTKQSFRKNSDINMIALSGEYYLKKNMYNKSVSKTCVTSHHKHVC